MRRRRLAKLIAIIVLVLILAFLAIWYVNFRATKSLKFDFIQTTEDAITPPSYLYMFRGTETTGVKRPVGILATADVVYVADADQGLIFKFSPAGKFLGTLGKDRLVAPIYIAQNPVTKNLFVTDRSTHALLEFKTDGTWVGEFKPNLPKENQPDFETNGLQWIPVALGFGPDGTLYISDVLKGHRILKFDPKGKFQTEVGIAGIVTNPLDNPSWFQFPNSIKVHKGEVWISDSNNGRIQIFDKNLVFKRVIAVSGLPRGFGFLTTRSQDASATKSVEASAAKSKETTTVTDKLVVVDTLAHDATIWNVDGDKLVTFGQRGIREGEFSFPGDVSVGLRNLMFITDTVNSRVQVWGWPAEVSPVPTIVVPPYWYWCFSPLLLLPLFLIWRRKRRFSATADFIELMVAMESADLLPAPRRLWLIAPAEFERVEGLEDGDVRISDIMQAAEYSDSDVQALIKRLEIDHATAVVMSLAQRSRVFVTEDENLRRTAKLLDVDAIDHIAFLERYGKKTGRGE